MENSFFTRIMMGSKFGLRGSTTSNFDELDLRKILAKFNFSDDLDGRMGWSSQLVLE
jgi:hypothetical protein